MAVFHEFRAVLNYDVVAAAWIGSWSWKLAEHGVVVHSVRPRVNRSVGDRSSGLAPDSIVFVFLSVFSGQQTRPFFCVIVPADDADVVREDLGPHASAVGP